MLTNVTNVDNKLKVEIKPNDFLVREVLMGECCCRTVTSGNYFFFPYKI